MEQKIALVLGATGGIGGEVEAAFGEEFEEAAGAEAFESGEGVLRFVEEEQAADKGRVLIVMLGEEESAGIRRTDLAALLFDQMDALLEERKRTVRLLLVQVNRTKSQEVVCHI